MVCDTLDQMLPFFSVDNIFQHDVNSEWQLLNLQKASMLPEPFLPNLLN
jgi:hypothetical protein